MPQIRGQVPWESQTQFPQFTPEAYTRIFGNSPVFGGSRAWELYDLINQEAQRAGLAPSFLAAVIAHESGAGRGYNPTTGAEEAIIRHNNPGGLMAGNRHLDFPSIDAGIRSTAENAANNWLEGARRFGDYSLANFREVWAPSGASNDQRNLNRFWVSGTEHYLGNMGNPAQPWATPENLNWAVPPVSGQGISYQLADRLSGGPGALIGQPAPWDQPGIISPEYGHYLQTAGLMPANLMPSGGTDFTNTTWNAPAGSQPGWWGPWGAEAVHNWAQEGVSHGYDAPVMDMLRNLNYNLVDPGLAAGPGNAPLGGAPLAATGGVDLAHWIAQQWGTGWGSPGEDRLRSQIWPQWDPNISSGPATRTGGYLWDASPWRDQWDPNISSGPSNNTGGTVWDASPPAGAPPPGGGVLNWLPAGGGWGEPGPGGVGEQAGWAEIRQSGNPNSWIWNPATSGWGSFGGGGGISNSVQDYNRWYDDVMSGAVSQPEGGFNEVGNIANGDPNVMAVLADIQSGASNPMFLGSIWSPWHIGDPMPGTHWSASPPTQWYHNSGIGPGGVPIAPGYNTTPIWNPPQAAPPLPPPSNPWAGWDMTNVVNFNPQLSFGTANAFQ